MTHEQITALTLTEVLSVIFSRLVDFSPLPQGKRAWEANFGALYSDYLFNAALIKPTLEACEAEFIVYKAELTAEEDARIAAEIARLAELARIAAIQARWDLMPDIRPHMESTGLSQPNPAMLLKEIIENNDIVKLAALEAAFAQYTANQIIVNSQSIVERLRNERSVKLYESDWTQLADAPLTTEEKTQYRTYRRYLRALPAIWEGSHIAEPICLDFQDWTLNPPIYPEGI